MPTNSMGQVITIIRLIAMFFQLLLDGFMRLHKKTLSGYLLGHGPLREFLYVDDLEKPVCLLERWSALLRAVRAMLWGSPCLLMSELVICIRNLASR